MMYESESMKVWKWCMKVKVWKYESMKVKVWKYESESVKVKVWMLKCESKNGKQKWESKSVTDETRRDRPDQWKCESLIVRVIHLVTSDIFWELWLLLAALWPNLANYDNFWYFYEGTVHCATSWHLFSGTNTGFGIRDLLQKAPQRQCLEWSNMPYKYDIAFFH